MRVKSTSSKGIKQILITTACRQIEDIRWWLQQVEKDIANDINIPVDEKLLVKYCNMMSRFISKK